jgi:hypothetical protein
MDDHDDHQHSSVTIEIRILPETPGNWVQFLKGVFCVPGNQTVFYLLLTD